MAQETCARFIADMAAGKEAYWLVLSGAAGCGKSMLAEQMLKRAQTHNPGNVPVWMPKKQNGILDDDDRRPECVWISADRFAKRLLNGEFDLPQYLAADWCVVYDDLGAARDKSTFIADAIYQFSNHRLRKWTIWTTNLTLSEVSAKIDERVASRLIRDENRFVTIKAGDYALRRLRGGAE